MANCPTGEFRWNRARPACDGFGMQRGLSWTMARGWPGHAVVLAVTGQPDQVFPVAERIADGGYHGVCAIPAAIPDVLAMTEPDVVLLLADLSPADRVRVAAAHAQHGTQTGIVVHLMPAGDVDLLGIIADFLRRAPPRRRREA